MRFRGACAWAGCCRQEGYLSDFLGDVDKAGQARFLSQASNDRQKVLLSNECPLSFDIPDGGASFLAGGTAFDGDFGHILG